MTMYLYVNITVKGNVFRVTFFCTCTMDY